MPHKTSAKYILFSDIMEKTAVSAIFMSIYKKPPVYGSVFVDSGWLESVFDSRLSSSF